MIWPASSTWPASNGPQSFSAGRQERPDGLGAVGKVREASVDRIMVAAAIGMSVVFIAGVVVGVILMVATAIRKQDRRNALTQEPPDAARGIPWLNRVSPPDL